MIKLKKIWLDLSFVGIDEKTYSPDKKRVILTNQFCFYALIHALISWIILVSLSLLPHSHIFLIYTLFLGVTFYLNYNRRYRLAKLFFLVNIALNVFFYSNILSKETGVYLYYIPTVCLVLMLFNHNEKTFAGSIVTGILFFILVAEVKTIEIFYHVSMPKESIMALFLINFILSTSLTVIIIFQFSANTIKVERLLQEMIYEKELLNVALNESKEQLSYNLKNLSFLNERIIKNQQYVNESEANLKALIDNASDSIWSVDPDYKFLTINSKFKNDFLNTFGVNLRKGDNIFPPQLPKSIVFIWKELYERAFQGEKFVEEWTLEGQTFDVAFNPIIDQGEIKGVAVYSRDITEKKRLTTQIADSENTLRSLIENIDGGVSSFDKEGIVLYLNKRFIEYFELTFGIQIKVGDKMTEVLPADSQEIWNSIFNTAINGQRVRDEIKLMGKDQPVYFDLSVSPLINSKGLIEGITIFKQDITASKLAQEILIKSQKEAEEASKAKGHFLSTMSHELRTPMNAVIGMTHLLLQEDPKPEQVENLLTLKFSAENLLVIINDILDYNKIEAGKVVFENIDFNLKEMIARLKQSLQFQANDKNIQIKTLFDGDLPDLVKGDPYRINQILTNLLSNGIKFTSKGHVAIEVTVDSVSKDKLFLTFSVSDTGIGIPEDKLDVVFESFTQASDSITREYGGTGLGLAITKKLLNLLDSDIQVESKVGKGTRFYFKLAFHKSTGNQFVKPLKKPNHTKLDLSSIKVLIAEDHVINQKVADKFLKKLNIQTFIADNGLKALEMFKTNNFDLILMDLQMPELDGYETSLAIRDLSKEVPIIAMTASTMDDVRTKISNAGMNDFVSKPFDPNVLYEIIIKHLPKEKLPKSYFEA